MEHYRGVVFEHGPGWDSLTIPVVDFVLDNGGQVEQVKEKFGGLRVYTSFFEDKELRTKVYKRIDAAEKKSMRTCEQCGNPGIPREGGWIKTLCERCHNAK